MGRTRLQLVYVAVVWSGTAVALVLLPREGVWERPGVLLLAVFLAAFAGAQPIRIPELRTWMTATHPFILFAIGALGGWPAVIVALSGVAASIVARGRVRTSTLQSTFNVACLAFSAALSYGTFRLAGGRAGGELRSLLVPLTVATLTFFLVNTGLVAGAIALAQGRRAQGTWRKTFSWTTSAYLTGLTLAVVMLAIDRTVAGWGVLLAVPPCWLLIAYYRNYRARIDEKERRIRDVERLNTELEQTVLELREALTEVRTLRTLLPICSHCKKVRDDQQHWHEVETYLAKHSDLEFTHSVCDDCRRRHYPEYAD